MAIMTQIKIDKNSIAGDVVTYGVTLGAVLAVIIAAAPAIHLPSTATTILITVSTAIATVVAEARRVTGAKKVAKAQAADYALWESQIRADEAAKINAAKPAVRRTTKRVTGK